MCTRPITTDGNVFACRTCNECVAARRRAWVARAMAEKSGHEHTLCLALTYSDDTEESREAAKMFAYVDVRLFLARLRRAARYEAQKAHWNITPSVRFICAGEQGERNGRCHWHMILYSNFDITRLGEFRLRGKVVTDRADMMTVGKRKRRLNWSLWPSGFMTLQEPDEGGMNYVLSYCLKDQFTEEKSRDTMREARAENFATGLFRMSKRPAIGEDWLMRKMEHLDAEGAVLPSLNLVIPGYSGYWHPTGSFREKLLWCLVALNKRALWSTGAPAPQWASLLASCAENRSDMEILLGPQQEDPEDAESDEARFGRSSRETEGFQRRGEIRRRCGAQLACDWCLHECSAGVLAGFGVERYEDDEGVWRYRALDGWRSVSERQHTAGDGINPLCQRRGEKIARLVFPRSGGAGSASAGS